jgi:hypothetical protein
MTPAKWSDTQCPVIRLRHPELFDLTTNDMVVLSAGSVHLSQHYADLAKNDYPTFKKECGQYFVAGIMDAGEIIAILTFDANSVEEKQNITSTVTGGGLGWSAGGEASKTMEKYSEEKRLHIDYNKTGGAGIIPTRAEELRKAINELETWTDKNAKPYSIALLPYSDLPGGRNNKLLIFRRTTRILRKLTFS